MAVIEIAKIQVRRGQELQTGIPQLDPGEFGWAEDTEHLYVGKRISEGAASDENTRILTENDLGNIFTILGQAYSTATLNTLYRYRQDVPGLDNTVAVTLQNKLDTLNPTVIDFGGAVSTNTFVALDGVLGDAIDRLFDNNNPDIRTDLKRVLEIPAGRYYLSQTVKLPPNTQLKGAGPGMTRIRFDDTDTSMFETVDGEGNNYVNGMNAVSTTSARNVSIEGLTLEFLNTLPTAGALISLDNVTDARIENCEFITGFDENTTSTYGIVDHGIGIRVQGQGGPGLEMCRNISIINCKFNGLLTGVLATGTVVTPYIKDSKFKNLNQGIVFDTYDTLNGPTNGYISYNRFEDILEEAIYIGENPNGVNGSNLSTQNYFVRCGGTSMNEFTTSSSGVSVINFGSAGNKTVDDYFARRAKAINFINSSTFYYNPLVRGTTTIADSAVYTLDIPRNNPLPTPYTMIPLNGSNQVATVTYQLYNSNQSRKGTIVANIDPQGYVAISDTYTYIESLREEQGYITTSTGSGVNTLIVNSSTYPIFATVQESIGAWYLTGEYYPGKSAYINNVITSSSFYIVQTDSNDPVFDFQSTGTWTLLKSETSDIAAFYDRSNADDQNFITLTLDNPSLTTSTLNYQINIQT